MATVYAKPNESFDSTLKRFKRKVENEGIIKRIKSHEEYLKPSVKKKKKREEAEKVRRRKMNRAKKNNNMRKGPKKAK